MSGRHRGVGDEADRVFEGLHRVRVGADDHLGGDIDTGGHGLLDPGRIQIVDEIAKKAGVRHDLAREMDENILSNKDAWVTAAIIGTLFHESDYAQAIHQVVHSFSQVGSVVILGRGGGFAPPIGARLDVRIIAPMAYRVDQLAGRRGVGRKEATEAIKASDTQRRKFIKQMFGRDWSDPAEFDLTINTAQIHMAGAVSIIKHAWECKTGANVDQSFS